MSSYTCEDRETLTLVVHRLLALGVPFRVVPASLTVVATDESLKQAATGLVGGTVDFAFDREDARGTVSVGLKAKYGPSTADRRRRPP